MTKPKYYVVWQGKAPGIYEGWEDCKNQVEGVPGAKYKGFPSRELAVSAWNDDPRKYLVKEPGVSPPAIIAGSFIGSPDPDSICVDAACAGNPGILEYRGVDTCSGAELFRMGPFPEGTINLGEFLAIVHALAYMKQRDSHWPVYSDSRTAIAWVRKKAVNTNLAVNPVNKRLFDLVDRAIAWLKNNQWDNKILKWETGYWGEIPADFGRK
jgi:ribonuclease HI